jgi:phosphoribosyl-AMP cyclohydrolase
MVNELPVEFDANGLVPVVVQDAGTSAVLMLGFMNPEALTATRESGFVHFWSRSRGKLWKKGETSGNVLTVESIMVNCEENSLLIEATPTGATCHTGYPTCYYRRLEPDNSLTMIRDRWFDPADVYGIEPEGIGDLTRRWWTAYEQLKSNDYAEYSGTSRVLRAEEDAITPRIADELEELAGVLDGSHVHKGLAADIELEGGQVCYWLALTCIRNGLTWDDVRPDRALDGVVDAPNRATVASLLRANAGTWIPGAKGELAARAHETFGLVAMACAAGSVSSRDVIAGDLENVSARLTSYQAR